MSFAVIVLIAAGVVLLLLNLLDLMVRIAGGRIVTVVRGRDGRTSTSKTVVLLWTLLLAWALVALVIGGELVASHPCVGAAHAILGCEGSDVALLQLGWRHFLDAGVSGSYVILLGVPVLAGIAVNRTTPSRMKGGAPRTVLTAITELFTQDDGIIDIGALQYLIFTLVTATYFVVQFLAPGGSGLPTIPDTLVGLTTVSAGYYVATKAAETTKAAVTGVFPLPLHAGEPFTVIGTGLLADPASLTSFVPQITIDGIPAVDVTSGDDRLSAVAPAEIGAGGKPIVRRLCVLNPYGEIIPFPVECL